MEDALTEIESIVVNSTVRVYHKKGRNGMSMHLEKGLPWVVYDDIRVEPSGGGTRKYNADKCHDQGDGQNEGGTCEVDEGLYPRKVVKPTTFRRGERCGRQIWWIGWKE